MRRLIVGTAWWCALAGGYLATVSAVTLSEVVTARLAASGPATTSLLVVPAAAYGRPAYGRPA
ncbi:hypothetical protein [Actinomadura litoris]|uniref:hypothetical protein n=1 Tax=Actinomadura litoris TaxID=2678616 RepID=UPI001FA6B065|nr:hypothetical protein [Actinomadura litoris]